MQKWEYLQIYSDGFSFAVVDSQGHYLKDEDYKAIDPKGKRDNEGLWRVNMARTVFLIAMLNKLGSEGWEAVGNVNAGRHPDMYLLLKRPTA